MSENGTIHKITCLSCDYKNVRWDLKFKQNRFILCDGCQLVFRQWNSCWIKLWKSFQKVENYWLPW